jgi:hypothetical protein
MAVSHTPGVQAMMKRDEASRGLGIELIDQGEGSHQLALAPTPPAS